MKKYFISFRYSRDRGVNGFSNTVKTSLGKVDFKQIADWEKEIGHSILCRKVAILFFQEIN